MQTTTVNQDSLLPLTCSRAGSCCFGNVVMLNPWDLYSLSKEKSISPRAFRDQYCEYGGIKLQFNGIANKKGKQACNQYIEGSGCSVHKGRPLACRLFPLGRQIQNNKVQYIYQGDRFPCLNECPEVLKLPKLTVGTYLEGQKTETFEIAQDMYLSIMQNIADVSFELLLDTGLSESGDKQTLPIWREMAKEDPEILKKRIGQEWIDILMIPEISDINKPDEFAQIHNDLLLIKAQETFENSSTLVEFHRGSVIMMGLALHLAHGLGIDKNTIAGHWISTAKSHGAQE
jgi:Fe-S-cluster containining protein